MNENVEIQNQVKGADVFEVVTMLKPISEK
jgi:hypothetical protein